MAKRGLGKGIGSLIGDYTHESRTVNNDLPTETETTGAVVVMLNMKKIESNPGQPRKNFDEAAMKELADSIREQGVLQPVLVEESPDVPDRYIIVAGERRFRAAKQVGLTHIPSLIRNFSEEQRLEVALIENIQRENLNPVEEAQAYKYLIEQVSLSQEELAKKIGKNRSTIANSIRILNLEPIMLQALEVGKISSGHARAILSVVNPAEQQILFKRIISENLSVRQAEVMAKGLNEGSRAVRNKTRKNDFQERPYEIRLVEEKFLNVLGTRVAVKGSLGKGKIEISYFSPEDLERVYQLMGGGGDGELYSQD
ncbi:MAG: ParB/RepB/Spo0J family partition protein [Spirochaetia bacterium]|nr:ParB/RepB/Spo0J family partition protein [Spirochaetia bacterium]